LTRQDYRSGLICQPLRIQFFTVMGGIPKKRHFLAWYAMLQANTRLLERINAELEAETGLPLSWFEALAQLSWAPDACSRMGALADDLLLSRGGVTRLIARMEEAGLVRREIPAHDRRATYAHLTDKGREAFERALPVHVAKVHAYFHQHLTDEEIDVLIRVMGKVLRGLDADVDWLLEDLEAASQ
jgi:DNA-binding MarR family transcriptional regulator